MSEEILINVTPQETRVAVVENGVLQEVYIERTLKRGLVGNIFKGRVSRVLPGMQAAFIDIGLERTRATATYRIHTQRRRRNPGTGSQGPHWQQGCQTYYPLINSFTLYRFYSRLCIHRHIATYRRRGRARAPAQYYPWLPDRHREVGRG